jgi:chromosome partitioning protein
VTGFGTPSCPVILPDRAAYRHASAEGRTVLELEPAGKAAEEVRSIYRGTCRQIDMSVSKPEKDRR